MYWTERSFAQTGKPMDIPERPRQRSEGDL